MTTEQKVDRLCEDFLKRNGSNFTSVCRSGRIGWEDTLPKGSAYSASMLSVSSSEELHKVAYSHARDMIIAMNTPFKVKIALTSEVSCTDHKTVSVATDMFDDPRLSVGEIIDIFTGLAIHEGCHLLYTDMSMMALAKNRIIANLFNIIEDERIEMLCGEDRPGLSNFLGCTKYYYFDKHSSRLAEMDDEGKLNRISRLLNCILAMIRYPKALVEEDVAEFADTLLDVKQVIFPYPDTCRAALEAAGKVYDIIKHYFEQEEQHPNGGSRSQGGKAGNHPGHELADERLTQQLEAILQSMEREIALPHDRTLDKSRMSSEVSKDNGRLARALAGEIEIGKIAHVNICRPKPSKQNYEESLDRVRRFVPAISKILRSNGCDSRLALRGLRSGTLDTNKLAEAVQGVEAIYRRETIVKADRMAVCILVDESGSMSGDKIVSARDTAILLNEALVAVPNVKLFIYGHTTDGDEFVRLTAYREGLACKDRYALGGIDADWSNVDSLAIREAAGRVRARTKERCLFFVISDGAPCEPKSNVRTAVRELSKDNFVFVSIGIDFSYDPSEMYDRHVSMTDMERLAPELGKMIKNAIMDNSKRQ